MKLTIPAPQNIKRREAFLLTHPTYYPEARFKAELSKIIQIRASKKLRWALPNIKLETQSERMKETSKSFEVIPKKQGFMKRITNIFKPSRG